MYLINIKTERYSPCPKSQKTVYSLRFLLSDYGQVLPSWATATPHSPSPDSLPAKGSRGRRPGPEDSRWDPQRHPEPAHYSLNPLSRPQGPGSRRIQSSCSLPAEGHTLHPASQSGPSCQTLWLTSDCRTCRALLSKKTRGVQETTAPPSSAFPAYAVTPACGLPIFHEDRQA